MNNPKFNFNFVLFEYTLNDTDKLNLEKASQTTDIPVPIIKGNKDVKALFTHHNFNNSLSSSSFSTGLKYADVRSTFKKDDKMTKLTRKTTDQLKILPNISKTYAYVWLVVSLL